MITSTIHLTIILLDPAAANLPAGLAYCSNMLDYDLAQHVALPLLQGKFQPRPVCFITGSHARDAIVEGHSSTEPCASRCSVSKWLGPPGIGWMLTQSDVQAQELGQTNQPGSQ